MRTITALLLSGFSLLLPTRSADARQAGAKRPVQSRPGGGTDILVTGSRSGCPATPARPGTAEIDYACLNAELKRAATAPPPAPRAADASAREATTPNRVGTFSYSATAQRMGANFGKSAQPYRPPAPVYANPIRGAAPK